MLPWLGYMMHVYLTAQLRSFSVRSGMTILQMACVLYIRMIWIFSCNIIVLSAVSRGEMSAVISGWIFDLTSMCIVLSEYGNETFFHSIKVHLTNSVLILGRGVLYLNADLSEHIDAGEIWWDVFPCLQILLWWHLLGTSCIRLHVSGLWQNLFMMDRGFFILQQN